MAAAKVPSRRDRWDHRDVRASQTALGRRRLRVGACLSLSGRYDRFGRQAARGLDVWRPLDGAADLIVEGDRSDPRTLETALPPPCGRPPGRS